jgi:hypothetical protein
VLVASPVSLVALSPAWPGASSRPDESGLYRARPESLPEWAQRGSFRFARLDGGAIESRKAERTWWGSAFTPDEKDALANVYGRHFPRVLALLKEAHVNWIWVTWSNGWTFAQEAENRAQLAHVIAECHRNGIHVTAYMSASNLFWRSTFRDEPQTRRWLLYWHGLPVPYGGSTHRLLADVGKPAWREYLLRKAALALDAGADAIFYDNIFGDPAGNKLLLSETQRLAESRAAASGQPKALVYANVHPAPGRFDINDQADVLWDESGKDSPGVWPSGWYVANARMIKLIAGEKQAWQPLAYENDLYHCGPREACVPAPAEQELGIAEGYAFGAATSRNIEGKLLGGLVAGDPAALASWAAVARYNGFVADHVPLYRDATSVARVAVLATDADDRFADALIRRSVIFDTKVLQHLDKGLPLERFQVLVAPFGPPELDEGQRRALTAFAARGGTILTTDASGWRGALGAAAAARVASLPRSGGADGAIAQAVNRAAGGPVVQVHGGRAVLANVTRGGGGERLVHVLNYDRAAPADDVEVTVELGDLARARRLDVRLVSPDGRPDSTPTLTRRGDTVTFHTGPLRRYAVAVIAAVPLD